MKRRILISALMAFICLVVPAFSQIAVGQSVLIKIMGVPVEQKAQIDESYPVSKNGMVNLPYIGEIKAAGLESHELAQSIQKAYRDGQIFVNPTIQVIANDNEGVPLAEVVHVAGQVRAPGPRPFTRGLTVFQAVQAAGGPNEFGAMNRVILMRGGKHTKIDLKTPAGKGVVTEPADTIEVPQKNLIGG